MMPAPMAPYLREKIVELGTRGFSPKEIIKRMPTPVRVGVVYQVLRKARERGVPVPKFSPGTAKGSRDVTCALVFAARNKDRLEPFAERRGLSVPQLAAQLIETILNDGLVDAILDDGTSP